MTPEQVVATFEAERPRLTGLAYRLLGSLADAEDVVQDAWGRWAGADHDAVERPAAWLTTVVSRLGLDRLRRRQREQVDYVGPWLPEPLVGSPGGAVGVSAGVRGDPAGAAELADSLTTAYLVLLERLEPTERLVLLLADVFGEPYAAIAEVVGRSPGACRQVASRARRRVRDGGAPRQAADADTLALAERFVDALATGDEATLVALLDPDVVVRSDGGAHVRAARRPVVGVRRAARLLLNLGGRIPPEVTVELAAVNGGAGVVARLGGTAVLVLSTTWAEGRLVQVHSVLNPDKLAAVDDPPLLA